MISLLPFLLEVACPDGFVKLISIQANGLGCSIGSCNERHRYEKIEYCARDCLSNNECKYFSWIDGKSSKDSNLCTLYAGTNSLDQTPNEPLQCKQSCSEAPKNICAARSYRRVAAGCRTEAIDFIETKSECEQAANQFGLLPVHDVLRPSWAFGCMFNKNTSVPWFNHVGRKRIQPKDDELAICRNIGCTEEDADKLTRFPRLLGETSSQCEKWAARKTNLPQACSTKWAQTMCKRTCCRLVRDSLSSALLQKAKSISEPVTSRVTRSAYGKLPCASVDPLHAGALKIGGQSRFKLKNLDSLDECYAKCDMSPRCVGFHVQKGFCLWHSEDQKLVYDSACKTPYYDKRNNGIRTSFTRPIAGNGLAQIGFVQELCPQISLSTAMNTWTMEDLYPPSKQQCVGDRTFLKAQDAPPKHCTRDTGFNQFLLESLNLRRWQTATWNYPVPVVVVPSIVMHCFDENLGKHAFTKISVIHKTLKPKLDDYWAFIKTKFYRPEHGFKPIIVVYMSWANDDVLIQQLALSIARQTPDDFVNRVVIGSIDGANMPLEVTTTLAQSRSRPMLVTMPYPVGMTTASRWAHRSGSYKPKSRRPISVLFTGSYHNRYGDKPVRYALRNLLAPFGSGKENMMICAHSGLLPSQLCGVKRMYRNTHLTTYMIAAHADFCLEPSGDTPTRSHLYLAVLSGCIPVIFDHEHQPFKHDHSVNTPWRRRTYYQGQLEHGNFNDLETAWAWRNTPDGFRLNYSEFAVVVDAGLKMGLHGEWVQPSFRSIIDQLHKMPESNRDRFRSLRRGVDHAAAWIRYAMQECDSPNCDAFAVFKDLVNSRATNFTRVPFDVEGNRAPMNLPRELPPRCGGKCEWTVISSEYGCKTNDDGIAGRWESYLFPSLRECKMSCEADIHCKAVDFKAATSLCVTFAKACTSPTAKGFVSYKLVRGMKQF